TFSPGSATRTAHLPGSGMQRRCVRDCQHPWFGGEGECVVDSDGANACLCNSGFSTFDVLGQPSCENELARTACHCAGCILSAACFVIAVRRLCKTETARSSAVRSAMLISSPRGGNGGTAAPSLGLYSRPRIVAMVLSASVLWSVFVFTFHVTAWKTRASLQTPLFPLMMTAVACGAVAALGTLRLWLFVLPSRLMKKTSIPTVIKAWFDGRHGLPCLCVCYAAWLLAVGIVGRFNSFSVTLSKAIRDSERSTPKVAPSPSSHQSSPVARVVPAKGFITRLWERLTCGSIGGVDGGVRGGGSAGIVPKTCGVYATTKSMLKKLTVASFAVIAAVMSTVVGS
ncbi:unnamed protein product, partial [Ectocarpus sp. 13 AM-2016]